jgi:hypothetical protein
MSAILSHSPFPETPTTARRSRSVVPPTAPPTVPPSPTLPLHSASAGVESFGTSAWLARAAASWTRGEMRRAASLTQRDAAATAMSRERRYDLD